MRHATWLCVGLILLPHAAGVYATDPVGDVQADPLGEAPDQADLLAFQVGPGNETHLTASIWLAALPEPPDEPKEITYRVEGVMGDLDVTWRATLDAAPPAGDGEWSYSLQVSGPGLSVGVRMPGAVDPAAGRIDMHAERFHLQDPAKGDRITDLTAQALYGAYTYTYGCNTQACDDASTDETFRFNQSTGVGGRIDAAAPAVAPGDNAAWNGTYTFTGPDTTYASSDPISLDFRLAAPDGWNASVSPGQAALQEGEAIDLAFTLDVPAQAASAAVHLVVDDGERRSRIPLDLTWLEDEVEDPVPAGNTTGRDATPSGKDSPVGAVALLAIVAALGRRRPA